MRFSFDKIALSYFSKPLYKRIAFSFLYGILLSIIELLGMIYEKSISYSFLGCTILCISGISVLIQLLVALCPGILEISSTFSSRGNLIEDARKVQNSKSSMFYIVLMIHFVVFLIFFVIILSSVIKK